MRNSKGQFASKKKLIFNTLLIVSMLTIYAGYYFSTIEASEEYVSFNCDLPSPVSCDQLYGINYQELDNSFTMPAMDPKDTEIERLKDELNSRYENMTIEEKIKYVFGKDGELMVRIARCESGLNPKAKNSSSSARGLFQILSKLHQVKEQWLYDEDVNIAIARQMFDASGTRPWNASKHCWNK